MPTILDVLVGAVGQSPGFAAELKPSCIAAVVSLTSCSTYSPHYAGPSSSCSAATSFEPGGLAWDKLFALEAQILMPHLNGRPGPFN